MSVRTLLEEYNNNKLRCEWLRRRIKELNKDYTYNSHCLRDGSQKNIYIQSPVESQVINKIEETEKLQEQINATELDIKIVDYAINILKDYKRNVIRMRFLEKKSPMTISEYYDKSEDAIHKTINKSIEEMDLIIYNL